MKPEVKIELAVEDKKIEAGSLVTYNARLGFISFNQTFEDKITGYYVFNIGTSKIESWPKEASKLFKGKIIIEQ